MLADDSALRAVLLDSRACSDTCTEESSVRPNMATISVAFCEELVTLA